MAANGVGYFGRGIWGNHFWASTFWSAGAFAPVTGVVPDVTQRGHRRTFVVYARPRGNPP